MRQTLGKLIALYALIGACRDRKQPSRVELVSMQAFRGPIVMASGRVRLTRQIFFDKDGQILDPWRREPFVFRHRVATAMKRKRG